jgi:ABC-type glycerol-3-phosphate transport system substrate-binding protein
VTTGAVTGKPLCLAVTGTGTWAPQGEEDGNAPAQKEGNVDTGKRLTRREALRALAVASAAAALGGCKPQVVEKVVKETVPVEKIVKETVLAPTPAPAGQVSNTLCVHEHPQWLDFHEREIAYYREDHPNVDITVVVYPMEEMVQKLVVGWSAGVGDTLAGVFGPWLPTFVKGGYIDEAPPDVVDLLKTDFYDIQIAGATVNGKIYTIPKEVGTPLPLYSRKVWEMIGVVDDAQFPQTYDQLLEVLQKFEAFPDIQGFCMEPVGIFTIIDWTTILMGYGASVVDEDGTRANFNNEAGREATEVYKALHRKENDSNLFASGKGALVWLGSWYRPWFADPKMPVKVGPPHKGPARRVHANYQWDWVVNAHATPEQKAVAWDHAKFLVSRPAQIDCWNLVTTMPFTKSAYEDPVLKKDGFMLAFAQYLPETQNYYVPIPAWEPIEKTVIAQLERLGADEISVHDFVTETEKQVNAALAEG